MVYFITTEILSDLDDETKLKLLQNISLLIEAYVIPVFMILGIFGNVLSFVVFIRSRKRADASVQYFSTLALSDTGFILFLGVTDWINYGLGYITNGAFAFNIWNYSHATCKFIGFAKHVVEIVSAWAIATFTIERAFVVLFPLKRANITPTKRSTVIGLIWFMSVALSVHRLILNHVYLEAGIPICFYNTSSFLQLVIWQLDTTIHNYIPVCLICISNVTILVGLQRAKKTFDSKTAVSRKQTQDNRIVVSLLLVSTLYIVFMMPASVMTTYLFVSASQNAPPEYVQVMYYVTTLFDEYSLMNYCFNFIIYGCTLPFYRDVVMSMFRVKKVRTVREA
jgi:hypothetical protein